MKQNKTIFTECLLFFVSPHYSESRLNRFVLIFAPTSKHVQVPLDNNSQLLDSSQVVHFKGRYHVGLVRNPRRFRRLQALGREKAEELGKPLQRLRIARKCQKGKQCTEIPAFNVKKGQFNTIFSLVKVVKLKLFDKFEDTTEALSAAAASVEGKMSKNLKKMLKKLDVKEKLAVADAKLGQSIQSKLDLDCVYDSKVAELMRCIRSQVGK